MASTIGTINPYRYKTYYYDEETQLYYLQSRYYDAEVGIFVSADEPTLLGSSKSIQMFNLYLYCDSNPTNLFDPTGSFVFSIVGMTIQVGALVGVSFSVWVVHDTEANHGLLLTISYMFMMPQVSISYSPFVSFKKSVYSLVGNSIVFGFGFETAYSIVIDVSFDLSGLSTIQFSTGFGISFPIDWDIHLGVSRTIFIPFKVLKKQRKTYVNVNLLGYKRSFVLTYRV